MKLHIRVKANLYRAVYDHLGKGEISEYIRDLIIKDLGLPAEPANRLSTEKKRDILIDWHRTYDTGQNIADRHGVSQHAVSKIISRHLDEEKKYQWKAHHNTQLKYGQ